jgi:hypothetical protein
MVGPEAFLLSLSDRIRLPQLQDFTLATQGLN